MNTDTTFDLTETSSEERLYVNPWYRKPENRKAMLEERKVWYQKHREEVLARRKVKIKCELCGGVYTPDHRPQHFRTMKHQSAEMAARNQVSSLLRLLAAR